MGLTAAVLARISVGSVWAEELVPAGDGRKEGLEVADVQTV